MMSFSLLDDDSESLSFDVFDTLDEINADQSGLSTDTATSEQEGAIPEDLLSDQEQFVDTSHLEHLGTERAQVNLDKAVNTQPVVEDQDVYSTGDGVSGPSEVDLKSAQDLLKAGGGHDHH